MCRQKWCYGWLCILGKKLVETFLIIVTNISNNSITILLPKCDMLFSSISCAYYHKNQLCIYQIQLYIFRYMQMHALLFICFACHVHIVFSTRNFSFACFSRFYNFLFLKCPFNSVLFSGICFSICWRVQWHYTAFISFNYLLFSIKKDCPSCLLCHILKPPLSFLR